MYKESTHPHTHTYTHAKYALKLLKSKCNVIIHYSHILLNLRFQIMTATVETVAEQLDLAAIMPAEKVVTAVARSVTLTDTDVGKLSGTLLRLC